MPLDRLAPQIDDRRFDDIVAEARTRIARYTPEWAPVWSDVNQSDPGITLVQLFAWMTELLLYRMARVPEANYIKFLQLLGIELAPAQPARVEITFPVAAEAPTSTVLIPLRTQVSAEADGGGPPIIFETERALVALQPRLDRVQVFDGYLHHDETLANDAFAPGFRPFGRTAAAGNALLLGFDGSGLFPSVELNLAFWAAPEPNPLPQPPVAFACGLPDTPVYPSARLVWEYWNGRTWQPLNLLKDETAALTRSGHIYLKTPAPGEMKSAVLGAVAEARHWIRARLARSAYERAPRLLGVRTNTVAAVQAETVTDEVLGGSDGSPNQVFQLANPPVLAGSLVLEVDEGDGFQAWSEVEDFFASGPRDRHYLLNPTSGEVRFGNGRYGEIPTGNAINPGGNVVARHYRFGGGLRGNVAAGRLTTLATPVAGIDEAAVANLLPAAGGRDEERLEDAKERARQTLKNKCRAVTPEDFESLAQQAGPIRRARALPLTHPDFPGVQVPGAITVVVVPAGDAPNPIPSEGTLRTVCAYLNQRRLLTTELYVVGPTYRQVTIDADLVVEGNADLGEVKTGVETALQTYFHPLSGGEEGKGWPFGGNIFYSRVYQRVFTVPGVARIARLVIVVDGEEAPECQDVEIPPGVLVYSTGHTIAVGYAFDE